MEAAITVPFSVCPLGVTRAGNSSLYSFSTVPVQTIGLRSSTETADCLDDFETSDTGIILAAAMYERILSLISIEWENLKINERISLCFQNNF